MLTGDPRLDSDSSSVKKLVLHRQGPYRERRDRSIRCPRAASWAAAADRGRHGRLGVLCDGDREETVLSAPLVRRPKTQRLPPQAPLPQAARVERTFRLASRLSVQLVRSSAAAGSKTATESVNDVRSGWMIGSSRSSKSAWAGAAVTADPVAIAAAARNTPAPAPTPTSRRRPALAFRACFLPSRPAIRFPRGVCIGQLRAQLAEPVLLSGFA